MFYFLPEGGGQGLVHLASGKAAFRLQFLQSFLYGSQNLSWRQVAEFIFGQVGNLGFGKTLFFLDCSNLNLNCLSPFYVSVVKMWRLMETGRLGPNASLYWLLMEPILKGARLGTSWEEIPMMSGTLINKGITTVQHLLELKWTML